MATMAYLNFSKHAKHVPGTGTAHQLFRSPFRKLRCRPPVCNASTLKASTLTAKDVLMRYYECYNSGDLENIAPLLAKECVYHDMIYEEPFVGRQEILEYLAHVRETVPSDLLFVIDDITDGDKDKVGVMWHVECGNKVELPFSRGCSFYNLNEAGEIIYARDLVESPVKPGSTSLQGLGTIVPIVRELGPKADPTMLNKLPIESALVWAFYAGYVSYIMLSTAAPGAPAYAVSTSELADVLYVSLNFFYINIALSAAGISAVPSIPVEPVYEALFNFVSAWGLLFLPVMLTEGRSVKVKGKVPWWLGIMFLTNVFFVPFLALRAAPEPPAPVTPSNNPSLSRVALQALAQRKPQPPPSLPLPSYAPAVGWVSAAVGVFSLFWAVLGRPEYGGLAERAAYWSEIMSTNRIFYAFVVDACLYCVWQAVMLKDAPPKYRFVPFFGLAAYLIAPPSPPQSQLPTK